MTWEFSAQRLVIATIFVVAGCTHSSVSAYSEPLPTGPAARVAPRVAEFVFSADSSVQPCSYRRHNDPQLRLYSWTVDVGGPDQPEWYAVDVWPAVPDSAALSLATILKAAQPSVVRLGGEPPLTLEFVDTTHVEAHDGWSTRNEPRVSRGGSRLLIDSLAISLLSRESAHYLPDNLSNQLTKDFEQKVHDEPYADAGWAVSAVDAASLRACTSALTTGSAPSARSGDGLTNHARPPPNGRGHTTGLWHWRLRASTAPPRDLSRRSRG